MRSTAAQVERYNRCARVVEVGLVAALVVMVTLGLVLLIRDAHRTQELTRDVKALVEERRAEARQQVAEEEERDRERQAAQQRGDALAADAVLCIVGELRAHRVSDKTIHDRLLAALRLRAPYLPPEVGSIDPPSLPYKDACNRFETVLKNGGPG